MVCTRTTNVRGWELERDFVVGTKKDFGSRNPFSQSTSPLLS